MFYALINYTHLKSESLDQFRRKYDPWVDLITDHLTFIFPIPDSVGLDPLVNHIQGILEDTKPFDVHISGLEKSWDHFLLLTIKEGNDEIHRLYDRFYTGLLAPYQRRDLPFVPHIGLGLFVEEDYDILDPKKLTLDENRFKKAFKEAQNLNFDFWRKVDTFTLVTFDEHFTEYRDIREFKLK
jgi:2'-5' RNA ligase